MAQKDNYMSPFYLARTRQNHDDAVHAPIVMHDTPAIHRNLGS